MELYFSISIQVVANTFWLFAIIVENNQRAKEVREEYDNDKD